MTKKDYELIAGAINFGVAGNTIEPEGDIMAIINAVATALAKDNPRFDRERFMKACRVSA